MNQISKDHIAATEKILKKCKEAAKYSKDALFKNKVLNFCSSIEYSVNYFISNDIDLTVEFIEKSKNLTNLVETLFDRLIAN